MTNIFALGEDLAADGFMLGDRAGNLFQEPGQGNFKRGGLGVMVSSARDVQVDCLRQR